MPLSCAGSAPNKSPNLLDQMTWQFNIVATKQQRVFSRILQTLESQLVSIHSFHAEGNGNAVRISFVVSSEEDKAYRIKALLYRLLDVESVTVVHGVESVREA